MKYTKKKKLMRIIQILFALLFSVLLIFSLITPMFANEYSLWAHSYFIDKKYYDPSPKDNINYDKKVYYLDEGEKLTLIGAVDLTMLNDDEKVKGYQIKTDPPNVLILEDNLDFKSNTKQMIFAKDVILADNAPLEERVCFTVSFEYEEERFGEKYHQAYTGYVITGSVPEELIKKEQDDAAWLAQREFPEGFDDGVAKLDEVLDEREKDIIVLTPEEIEVIQNTQNPPKPIDTEKIFDNFIIYLSAFSILLALLILFTILRQKKREKIKNNEIYYT